MAAIQLFHYPNKSIKIANEESQHFFSHKIGGFSREVALLIHGSRKGPLRPLTMEARSQPHSGRVPLIGEPPNSLAKP